MQTPSLFLPLLSTDMREDVWPGARSAQVHMTHFLWILALTELWLSPCFDQLKDMEETQVASGCV